MLFKSCIAFAVFFSILVTPAKAQVKSRSGYIGVGVGPSFLTGVDVANKKTLVGLHINLLDAGYVFYKGLGVNAIWSGAGFVHENEPDAPNVFRSEVFIGTLMLGPMYSLDLSETANLRFMGRVGPLTIKEQGVSNSEHMRLSWSIATAYQKRIGERLALTVSANYYHSQPYDYSGGESIGLINVTGGIAFLL